MSDFCFWGQAFGDLEVERIALKIDQSIRNTGVVDPTSYLINSLSNGLNVMCLHGCLVSYPSLFSVLTVNRRLDGV